MEEEEDGFGFWEKEMEVFGGDGGKEREKVKVVNGRMMSMSGWCVENGEGKFKYKAKISEKMWEWPNQFSFSSSPIRFAPKNKCEHGHNFAKNKAKGGGKKGVREKVMMERKGVG